MSTECEYPVTIPGNQRETIDVSEVMDFSVNQRQRAKAETSRKNGVRLVSRPLAGCRKNRAIRPLPGAASPRHREEDLLRCRNAISEDNLGQSILVFGIGVSSPACHPERCEGSALAFWSLPCLNSTIEPGTSLRSAAPATPISR